nr:MAG TPA: hypothetical protein [Caudoviricetes sp.]
MYSLIIKGVTFFLGYQRRSPRIYEYVYVRIHAFIP